jgi:hypothetical protein
MGCGFPRIPPSRRKKAQTKVSGQGDNVAVKLAIKQYPPPQKPPSTRRTSVRHLTTSVKRILPKATGQY